MQFICQIVESKDQNGRLDGVGVRWREPQIWLEWNTRNLAYASIIVAGCFVPLGISHGKTDGWFSFYPVLVYVLFIIHWALSCWSQEMPGKTRELLFMRNDVAVAPHGLSTWSYWHRRMIDPHSEIASVEWEQLSQPDQHFDWPNYTHGIMIVLNDGSVCRVAQNLEPDNARQLVVALTRALAKMRVQMSMIDHQHTASVTMLID